MQLTESDSTSFIIKIWLEETARRNSPVKWRGHITHVPSGKRRYLEDLAEIIIFMVPYLEAIGVKVGVRFRVGQWMIRQILRLRRRA